MSVALAAELEAPSRPSHERLEELEQAVAVYFGGTAPVGMVGTQLDAERIITAAVHRALERA